MSTLLMKLWISCVISKRTLLQGTLQSYKPHGHCPDSSNNLLLCKVLITRLALITRPLMTMMLVCSCLSLFTKPAFAYRSSSRQMNTAVYQLVIRINPKPLTHLTKSDLDTLLMPALNDNVPVTTSCTPHSLLRHDGTVLFGVSPPLPSNSP